MADKELIDKLRGQISSMEGGSARSPGTRLAGKGASGEPGNRPTLRKDPASAKAEEALGKIIALVNVSDRSEKTIRERLLQAHFDPAAIDEAVERAKAYGFIDDMRYAEVLARSRLSQGRGVWGLERELHDQGIDLDLRDLPGWPDEFAVDEDSEVARALELLERKPPRSKNLREGAYRKLVGRGFSPSVAATASRSWCDGAAERL